jgi:tRNA threonylcarbamoyladenosine biosynthesis protein TsaB
MKLLAFDTSTEACSAALYIDGEITSLYKIAPQRHAELILPMINQVLSLGQTTLPDLDAIAFGRGPGSFTGVRIATGIAQGLAFSVDLPLIPVSSLATLAQSVKDEADYIAAAIDARMGEIYFALYKSENAVELIGEEIVVHPANLEIKDTPACYGAGSGWLSYTDTLKTVFQNKLTGYKGDQFPDAKDLVLLAVDAYKKGILVKPENATPVYLRDKVTG